MKYEEVYKSGEYFRHKDTDKMIMFRRDPDTTKIQIYRDGKLWKSEHWHFWTAEELQDNGWEIIPSIK